MLLDGGSGLEVLGWEKLRKIAEVSRYVRRVVSDLLDRSKDLLFYMLLFLLLLLSLLLRNNALLMYFDFFHRVFLRH